MRRLNRDMSSPVHTFQTRRRMKQIISNSRIIGLFVLLLSCCLCGNSLPIPAATSSAAGAATHQEELQHENNEHERRTPETIQTESLAALYEGDILLPVSRPQSGRSKRAVTSLTRLRWENATVPYKFDMSFSTSARKKVLRAINHWHKNTCIRFVPRSDEREYVKFKFGSVCASYVGKYPREAFINYDGQLISLTESCVKQRGQIIHELGHAIGFWHEHTRPDRDDHVEILWENIKSTHRETFEKRWQNATDSLGVPYDLGSIMQYNVYAFSRNEQPTIRVLDTDFTGEVGQRDHLSEYDSRQANLFYHCDVEDRAINNGAVTEGLNVIRTGQEIALKVEPEDSNQHLWINCTEDRCRLDGCPGNRFKPEKQNTCTDHVYTLHKLDCSNGKQAMVGDEVVLRKHSAGSQTSVYCGLAGNCRASTECEADGHFNRTACLDQIMLLKVPSKENGSFLMHKDEMTLQYAYRDGRRDGSERGEWIGCEVGGERTCKRRACTVNRSGGGVSGNSHQPQVCRQDRFVVYKL